MSLLFNFLDLVLILIMLYDTLGLIYQFRKSKESVKSQEFIRISFSWILFLTIYNTFSCSWKGFFGTLIRLIIFLAKAAVTIPLLGGTMKIHKYLIIDGNAEKYINLVYEKIKSATNKGVKDLSQTASKVISDNIPSETQEPENKSEETVPPS